MVAICATIVLGAASCSSDNEITESKQQQSKEVTITAGDPSSRVAFTDNSNSMNLSWEATDQLSVYWGSFSDATKGTFTTTAADISSALQATFKGTMTGSGSNIYTYVSNSNVTWNTTAKTATINLASQTGTIAAATGLDLLFCNINNYANENTINMTFKHSMAILKLTVTVPTTENVSSLVLNATSGLYNNVVLNAEGATLNTGSSGNISITSPTWTTEANNYKTTTVYVCVYPGQVNDLHLFATTATSGTVYGAKIGSKLMAAGTFYPMTKASTAFETFSGTGASSTPYLVDDELKLRTLAYVCNNSNTNYTTKSYQQTANISLNGKGWIPINNFSGTYDGNSKSITGTMNLTYTTIHYGLFGSVTNATIKGLSMSTTITLPTSLTPTSTRTYMGAIVAKAYNSTISDCNNTSDITGACAYIGSIAGCISGGSIIHCSNTGILNNASSTFIETLVPSYTSSYCSGPCIGGIVGDIYCDANETAIIEACMNSGNIIGNTTIDYASAGGIAGYICNNNTSKNIIRGCYSGKGTTATTLTISGKNIGGLAGDVYSNASAGSTVTAANSVITSCWSACTLTSSSYKGSVVGYSTNSNYDYCAAYNNNTYIGFSSLNKSYQKNISYKTSGTNSTNTDLSYWTTANTTNLNTEWETLNTNRLYKFNTDGSLVLK